MKACSKEIEQKSNEAKRNKIFSKIILTRLYSKVGFTLHYTCITYLALIMGHYYYEHKK